MSPQATAAPTTSLLRYAMQQHTAERRIERRRQVVLIYENVKQKFKNKNPVRVTAKITGFSVWMVYKIIRGVR